ncbi:hypothetical protein [Bacillus dakarensis]|nr:hypothetical protein [Bacillus dakarensis]
MIHTESKNKMKSIEFTLKEQPKLKQDQCKKCKTCSCLANKEKELVN